MINLNTINRPFIPRIEICGNIASGKTTLASVLAGDTFKCIKEDFSSHPFLDQFYIDPVRYAFETETTFIMQHYHQINSSKYNELLICDFSLFQDMAYARCNLYIERYELIKSLCNNIITEIGWPLLLLHIKSSPYILLDRIRMRGRAFESSITVEYLEAIEAALNETIISLHENINVITIDSCPNNFINMDETSIIGYIKRIIHEFSISN